MRTILETPGRPEEERGGALWALYGLKADDPETIRLRGRSLGHAKHRNVARATLLQTGSPEARRLLAESLDGGRNPSDDWLLRAHADTRDAALRALGNAYGGDTPFRSMFHDAAAVELLGEIQGPTVAEYLLREAPPVETNLNVAGRRRRVLRVLARHDRDAAYEAAKASLVRARHDRHLYAGVLTEIDADRAVPFLCGHLPAEPSLRVRRAMYVALRHSGTAEPVRVAVAGLVEGDAVRRVAAAEIVGWTGGAEAADLAARAANERSPHVRRKMRAAIASLDTERHAADLLQGFGTATGVGQWRLADAVLDLAPSECLSRKSDALWIGGILGRLPPVLRDHVNERYRAATQNLDRDLRDRTVD